LLHRVPQGQDIQLTLDADLQQRAQQALDGEAGAAVLMEVKTGRVLAMASAPTFDPARLGEAWESLREDPSAPLLNRATQGLYQPGAVLQTVVVAEALLEGLVDDLAVDVGSELTERVAVDGVEVGCSVLPDGAPTLASAYAAACPAPIGGLGERLGADGLAGAVDRWRLTIPPPLAIPTESADWTPEEISSAKDEAIGQGTLTVSPLHMALVAATVANGGTMPDPQLAPRTRDGARGWQGVPMGGDSQSILSPTEARRLLSAWRRWDESGLASVGGGVVGHWGVAVAGEGAPHAWFLGVAPSGGDPGYALAVLVEHAEEPKRAVAIGTRLLEAALEEAE
jgi:peptidoglycan glycosyltransferase